MKNKFYLLKIFLLIFFLSSHLLIAKNLKISLYLCESTPDKFTELVIDNSKTDSSIIMDKIATLELKNNELARFDSTKNLADDMSIDKQYPPSKIEIKNIKNALNNYKVGIKFTASYITGVKSNLSNFIYCNLYFNEFQGFIEDEKLKLYPTFETIDIEKQLLVLEKNKFTLIRNGYYKKTIYTADTKVDSFMFFMVKIDNISDVDEK